MSDGETLVEAALRVLNTADPVQKAKLGDQIANNWVQGVISNPYRPSQPDFIVPDRPARLANVRFSRCQNNSLNVFAGFVSPSKHTKCSIKCFGWYNYGQFIVQVKLVSPSLMPKLGKAGSLQSRQAIVHSLVHTESWAIDLSWDIIARFGKQESMPREFFDDFVRVAQDEGRHFTLLATRLEELGSFYGALPAHDGLWDSAVATSKDLFARLAVEHCVHEARGLDVLPTTISRFRNGGDNETADLLEKVIYPEEITHCAAGVKWFKYLCSRPTVISCGHVKDEEESEEVIQKFHEVVRAYFRGPLKPPFNEAARKTAGFGPQWYEPLAVKDFTQ